MPKIKCINNIGIEDNVSVGKIYDAVQSFWPDMWEIGFYNYNKNLFVVVDKNPVEEAKKLLESNGYKVEKKRVGKVYIYVDNTSNQTYSTSSPKSINNADPLIAVVDWVEGDGL